MRYAIASGLMATGVMLFASLSGCGEKENTYGACVDFCDSLVDAMHESDWYHISSVSETKKHCKQECSDTLREMSSDDRSDAQDCIECVEGTIDPDEDWGMTELAIDAYESCESDCFDNDDNYAELDDDPFVFFSDDFFADFDEHWSTSSPGGGDGDVDADADADGDTDAFCPDYQGSDECCLLSNPCEYSDDGYCDCEGYCYWDALDCA